MNPTTSHHFNVEEAVKYGTEPAILITNIRFWLERGSNTNGEKTYAKEFQSDLTV